MKNKIITLFFLSISITFCYIFVTNDLQHNEISFTGIVSGLFAIASSITLLNERKKNEKKIK